MLTNPVFSSIFDDVNHVDRTKRIGTVYNIYRILIAAFFSLNFFLVLHSNYQNFWLLINFIPTFCYLAFSLMVALGYYFYPKNSLLMLGLAIDVSVLTIMLYFSGGTDLQIILLFLVTVAASFMLLRSKQAILITVFAITLVMYQQFFNALKSDVTYTLLSNVGLMALSFSGVAYLSHTLAKRLNQIENLSQRQSNEVNALNAINEKIVQIIEQGVLVVSHSLEILIANDTAINQLNLPKALESYFLPILSPRLAELLSPLITHAEDSVIFRLDELESSAYTSLSGADNANVAGDYQTHVEFRLRITQLGSEHALILIEDLRREQSHAQQLKLAALGQLTASIAHEIRNPLAAISQASQLLIEESKEADSHLTEDDSMLYDMIFKQTKRVNQIIEDVLKLSRQQKPNRMFIEARTWLSEFIDEQFSSHDVFLHCHSDNGFMFDKYQLEQVLINLINNGLRFSSKSHPHAYVTIEVNEVGRYIHIDVIDEGAGVSAENLQYLFNPFFTTDHQGTGLGLYLSQAFCQANHASLQYVPNHEHTCFRIVCDKKFLRQTNDTVTQG